MMTIKFSHDYLKLWGQRRAELVAVRILNAQAVNINKALLEYDTKTTDGKYYELPKNGELLQLVFVGDKNIPFCTLRSFTADKHQYYLRNIREVFIIKVGE